MLQIAQHVSKKKTKKAERFIFIFGTSESEAKKDDGSESVIEQNRTSQ